MTALAFSGNVFCVRSCGGGGAQRDDDDGDDAGDFVWASGPFVYRRRRRHSNNDTISQRIAQLPEGRVVTCLAVNDGDDETCSVAVGAHNEVFAFREGMPVPRYLGRIADRILAMRTVRNTSVLVLGQSGTLTNFDIDGTRKSTVCPLSEAASSTIGLCCSGVIGGGSRNDDEILLFVGTAFGELVQLSITDASPSTVRNRVKCHDNMVSCMSEVLLLSNNGNFAIATGSDERRASVVFFLNGGVDAADRVVPVRLPFEPGRVRSVVLAQSTTAHDDDDGGGVICITACEDGSTRAYEVTTAPQQGDNSNATLSWTCPSVHAGGLGGGAVSMCVARNRQVVISGGTDGRVSTRRFVQHRASPLWAAPVQFRCIGLAGDDIVLVAMPSPFLQQQQQQQQQRQEGTNIDVVVARASRDDRIRLTLSLPSSSSSSSSNNNNNNKTGLPSCITGFDEDGGDVVIIALGTTTGEVFLRALGGSDTTMRRLQFQQRVTVTQIAISKISDNTFSVMTCNAAGTVAVGRLVIARGGVETEASFREWTSVCRGRCFVLPDDKSAAAAAAVVHFTCDQDGVHALLASPSSDNASEVRRGVRCCTPRDAQFAAAADWCPVSMHWIENSTSRKVVGVVHSRSLLVHEVVFDVKTETARTSIAHAVSRGIGGRDVLASSPSFVLLHSGDSAAVLYDRRRGVESARSKVAEFTAARSRAAVLSASGARVAWSNDSQALFTESLCANSRSCGTTITVAESGCSDFTCAAFLGGGGGGGGGGENGSAGTGVVVTGSDDGTLTLWSNGKADAAADAQQLRKEASLLFHGSVFAVAQLSNFGFVGVGGGASISIWRVDPRTGLAMLEFARTAPGVGAERAREAELERFVSCDVCDGGGGGGGGDDATLAKMVYIAIGSSCGDVEVMQFVPPLPNERIAPPRTITKHRPGGGGGGGAGAGAAAAASPVMSVAVKTCLARLIVCSGMNNGTLAADILDGGGERQRERQQTEASLLLHDCLDRAGAVTALRFLDHQLPHLAAAREGGSVAVFRIDVSAAPFSSAVLWVLPSLTATPPRALVSSTSTLIVIEEGRRCVAIDPATGSVLGVRHTSAIRVRGAAIATGGDDRMFVAGQGIEMLAL